MPAPLTHIGRTVKLASLARGIALPDSALHYPLNVKKYGARGPMGQIRNVSNSSIPRGPLRGTAGKTIMEII